jgi:hypothetical protein
LSQETKKGAYKTLDYSTGSGNSSGDISDESGSNLSSSSAASDEKDYKSNIATTAAAAPAAGSTTTSATTTLPSMRRKPKDRGSAAAGMTATADSHHTKLSANRGTKRKHSRKPTPPDTVSEDADTDQELSQPDPDADS